LYVKFGSKVKRIVTTPFPKPAVSLSELSEITEEYACRLLVPIHVTNAERAAQETPVFDALGLKRRVLKQAG
jgi:hypothetical protein